MKMSLEMCLATVLQKVSERGRTAIVSEVQGNEFVRMRGVRVEDCPFCLIVRDGKSTGVTVDVIKVGDEDTVLHGIVMARVEVDALNIIVDGILAQEMK